MHLKASNLARLRHPSILEVVEPVTESRSSIAFATEPLMGTLSSLLRTNDSYSSAQTHDDGFELDELEIQKGLLQVGKGLQFLNDAKVVHHNLTPESIFVNAKGDWKIGGLGFSVFMNNPNEQAEDVYFEQNDYLPDQCQLDMDYAAPEFVLNSDVSQANDNFALGCLVYTVHNKGVSLLQTFNHKRTYERKIQSLETLDYSSMPQDLRGVIMRLLARQPSHRMTAVEFQSSRYFDNLLVSTMKFLESFPEKTREEKAQFMKGLTRVLNQFPERVLKRKILPSLLEELKDHQLLPYTVPNIFTITQKLSQQEFCDLVLPSLKPVFSIRDPPQNMIVLLEKLDVLQQKTPPEVFRDDVMPLVYAAIEAPTATVQEKALRIIPSLAECLHYTTVKSSLFPRVQLWQFTMQEKMVPLLKNIKTKEPAVMLATLAVYDEMGKHLDKEIIATEILPQLWRMSFGPLLNLDQFKKFMKTIRELTTRVEEAHTRHLQEVRSLEEQTRSVTSDSSSVLTKGNQIAGDNNMSFESLVQGKASQNNSSEDIFASMQKNVSYGGLTATVASTATPASTTNNGWSPAAPPRQSPMMTPMSATSSLGFSASRSQTSTRSSDSLGWTAPTTTIPALPTPPAFQTAASVPNASPLINSMNSLSIQPPVSKPNYSAMRDISMATPSRPVSTGNLTGMGLLQPTSNYTSQQHTSTLQPSSGHKMTNLNAFDPLG
ncbi:hypothetical protein DFQ28_004276 [Apophysomyces sp. BC1034]|nr:hypothetical protein DFQ30_003614 [Apophysomyces sp. BC1015]KAG0182015.1 hypothetical protein DFQ29_006133 [Apophysomyces sp. BC1021]KAG0193609.1 hypothetical protein DFQ28_004276 [Apophysomyces sp. BC1034]